LVVVGGAIRNSELTSWCRYAEQIIEECNRSWRELLMGEPKHGDISLQVKLEREIADADGTG